MRPLRLRLAAFCAYGGEVTLDFEHGLGPHRLFLITGPTGAGKTSVLDGLCYALFGESSGAERGPGHLRSHHAAPGTRTEVELDFALGAERWRIRRRPAWERPKLRGTGTVTEGAEVALWRLSADGAELVTEREAEARARIESLLGYRAQEFRQVVMLPQGRFRELLTAKPGERQQILATLFRTHLYERIERALAEAAKAAATEARRLEQHRQTLLGQAGAEGVEAAREARAGLAAALAEAEAQAEAANAAARSARAAAEAGRRDLERLERATRAAAALAALEAKATGMEAARARLTAARRADRLRGEAAAWRTAREAEAEAARRAAEAEAAAAAARDALARAEAALADAEARERAAAEAGAEATRLQGLLERAEATARATAEAEDAARKLAAAEASRNQAADAAAKARDAAEAARAALAAQKAVADQQERHRLVLKDAQARLRDAEALTKAEAEVARLRTALSEAEATGTAAAARHGTARAALADAIATVAADHAARLAAALAPGEPCPVCGATDHPRPAHLAASGGDAPLPDLAPLEAEEAAARTALDAARERFVRLRAELRAAEEAHANLLARFGEDAAPQPDALAAELAAARDALTAAETAARTLPTRQREAEAAEQAAREAVTRLEGAEASVQAAATALAAARATRDAHAAALPEGTAAPDALRAAAEAAQTRARTLAEGLRRDRDARVAAATRAEAAAQSAAAAAEAARGAEAARAAADTAFAARCVEADFADPAAFEAALLPDAEATELEATLAGFDRDRAAAAREDAAARAAAEGLAAPDLAALEAAAAKAEEAAQAATGVAAARRRDLEARDALLADIAAAEAELAAARAAWEMRQDLAETARGANPQRLSLQGYVLRTLLDEALSAANRRLRGMLHGRYSVRRVEEPERKNAAVGLDIAVLDEWTGQVRPAATLSGGEGFCASLALALGLADTVQAHAGGRRMDALFVDEGFGTLDPEALDTAMSVLSALPGSDRLVGVISHVPELRGWVPARLEVSPGRRGSTAAFRLG